MEILKKLYKNIIIFPLNGLTSPVVLYWLKQNRQMIPLIFSAKDIKNVVPHGTLSQEKFQ